MLHLDPSHIDRRPSYGLWHPVLKAGKQVCGDMTSQILENTTLDARAGDCCITHLRSLVLFFVTSDPHVGEDEGSIGKVRERMSFEAT